MKVAWFSTGLSSFLDELPEDVGRCQEVFPSCDIFCQLYLD